VWLLGRRIRGPTLGVALAYAWATYPFTLYVSNANSNDSLVAMLLVAALLVATSPVKRGVAVALAGLTKFAPLALAPLFATYGDGRFRLLKFSLAFLATIAVVMAPVILSGDLRTFYDHTLVYQNDRGSPFSVWGYYGGLGGLQTAVKIGAVVLALLVAFVPRQRDIRALAALGAAVIIALQLGITHWFYLYIVWFVPFVLVALLTPQAPRAETATDAEPSAEAREPEAVPAPA